MAVLPAGKLKNFFCRCLGMQKLFYLLTCLFIVGCNNVGPLKSAFTKAPPYEQYIQLLEKADLKESPMAEAWILAGKRVLQDSVIIQLPFSEAGYFPAGEPQARSYRFEVKEGQVLSITGDALTEKNARLFVDLFEWEEQQWKHITHADSSLSLSREFQEDKQLLLRMQPELLANIYYSISLSLSPVLVNPVAGGSNRSIGSFYGADREGGRRRHEGVDIFAPRGTPVIAPTDGYVSRVGTNKLGGKVVWMRDRSRGHSYYFAHLDEQLVQSGTSVKQGDTLGLVGNTGNARTTPPHLHFGIYQRGSKDPIHFIRSLEIMTNSPMDTSFQPEAFKVVAQKLNLRSGPGTQNPAIGQLEQDSWLKIIGRHGDWYRIALPNQKQAYVHQKLVAPVKEGKPLVLDGPSVLLSESRSDAVPVSFLQDSTVVEVLAGFQEYQYVKTAEGLYGWVLGTVQKAKM